MRLTALSIVSFLLMMPVVYAATVVMETPGEAQVVASVNVKDVNSPCDKYCWQDATVVSVISSTIDQAMPVEIRIAHYSWVKGLPQGISTVGLRKYGSGPNEWLLSNIPQGK